MTDHWILLSLLALCCPIVAAAEIPRPEHPRPDCQRAEWLNLNGAWQFEIDNEGTGEARGLMSGVDLADRITVPFCPESKLSGIAHTDFMTRVWYRRTFEVPQTMAGKRLRLHFGAVDWHAKVYLNGTLVGEHKGGYTPFWIEITRQVVDGPNELVVSAEDHTTSGKQATGKQSHERDSYGCVYTRTTGIWQTVWLEAVGETYTREFSVVTDPDTGLVSFTGWVDGPSAGASVRIAARDGHKKVAETVVPARGRSTAGVLSIDEPKLWHPGDPHLYDLTIAVERDGKTVDEVHSYFGMRKVHTDGNRFLINNQPVFQRLVLDQGFYPDGIYTAPTDEDLKRDIELSMAAGFNGARLHQKVFEPRLLYWADKLGYIVWGEYPNWGLNPDDPGAVAQAVLEWEEALRRDRNHPAVIGWCPLNETGGGEGNALAQALLGRLTQAADPTRPFLDASGYVHLYRDTEVYDSHNYDQNPASFGASLSMFALTGQDPFSNFLDDPRSAYQGQPYFVSEYGGTRLGSGSGDAAWGYGSATGDVREFVDRYRALTDVLMGNPNVFGFCYTQLTDIEQEQNGVYFYDRGEKYDPKLLREINERPAAYETEGPRLSRLEWIHAMPTSRDTARMWRYTETAPGDDWVEEEYDDSSWQEAPGGFGRPDTPGAVIGTEWLSDDVWIRRAFDLADTRFDRAFLEIHHDEDVEVYANGHEVTELTGYTTGYILVNGTELLRETLRAGRNTIAVHCHQTAGGQFIDVGIRFCRTDGDRQ